MINLKVAALSVVATSLAAFVLLTPSTDDNSVTKIAPVAKEVPQTSSDKNTDNLKVVQQRPPVEHGIADENGRQVGVESQSARIAPPPPASAPDSRSRQHANHSADQHGHERNHTSQTSNENTPPPPTGANKG